jgi:hypothetical protein
MHNTLPTIPTILVGEEYELFSKRCPEEYEVFSKHFVGVVLKTTPGPHGHDSILVLLCK